jgi:hypothetical protein
LSAAVAMAIPIMIAVATVCQPIPGSYPTARARGQSPDCGAKPARCRGSQANAKPGCYPKSQFELEIQMNSFGQKPSLLLDRGRMYRKTHSSLE